MDDPKPVASAPQPPPPSRIVLDSALLFRAAPEVEIRHAGEVYRLRRTRAGKLILTK